MALTKEMRAIMARDMQSNRKFDGDTDIPEECRAFAALADMEEVDRPAVGGFPYKIYIWRAKNRTENCPVHINIHGGGWLIGHMPNDSLWSAWLADQIQGIVVDLDYTTTEEASHPTALLQGCDAARWTFEHVKEWGGDPKRVSMGGYSAGGALTMGIEVETLMKNEALPFCLLINGYGPHDMRFDPSVLSIPEYWKTQKYRGEGFSALLSDEDPSVMEDPSIYIVGAPDEVLSSFPPTVILAAEGCTFRGQNMDLGVCLANHGVEVTMKVYPDTVHGFIPHFMKHWEEAADLIVRCIKGASL